MPLLRKIDIENFRCIKSLSFSPSSGTNCLIGPGDSGKSTILDAIDLCLGARRNLQVGDADFHALNVDSPIRISITLGALDDALLNIDSYGLYLRGFDQATGGIEDEPGLSLETALTVRLTIRADLEPEWCLISDRAEALGQSRGLSWADRVRLAPTRLGDYTDHNLCWTRGSILNKISEERVNASAALIKAARDARSAFGEQAKSQLATILKIVADTSRYLGVPVGDEVKALLDAHSVSFSGGTIALHDQDGIPLRCLGLGSTRLLIAGLQRCAAQQASVILVDELEHGLEPHRIIRLLDALGTKVKPPPLQIFMTTHSPVAVRELSGDQLFVVRSSNGCHEVRQVKTTNDVQGTIRRYPEALLAPAIIVCEGASEVGLIRGLDQHRQTEEKRPITACGVALVDGGGNDTFRRARAFQTLGYRTAVLRDSDVHPTPELEGEFIRGAGTVFAWQDNRSLEDELFRSLRNDSVSQLVAKAVEFKSETLIDEHIRSASNNATNLEAIRAELGKGLLSVADRTILGKASRHREARRSWFKSVSAMEIVAHEVVGPGLSESDTEFRRIIGQLFEWVEDAR